MPNANYNLEWFVRLGRIFEHVSHQISTRAEDDALDDIRYGLVWLLAGRVEDGLGSVAGTHLFTVFQPLNGEPPRRILPGRLIDFDPPAAPVLPGEHHHRLLNDPGAIEEWSLDHVLEPYLHEVQARRSQETRIVQDYLRRSFDVLIARSQAKLMDYERRSQHGTDMSLRTQDERRHLDDLRRRQLRRLGESQRAGLALGAPEIAGVAAVVPVLAAAGRTTGPAMRRSNPVEEAAMAHGMASEQ